MKKLKKSLAILLAIVMLASFTPLFASAAPVRLSVRNMEIAPPALSGYEFDYGIALSEITLTGGKVYYVDGETKTEVEGTWTMAQPTVVPEVQDEYFPRFKFTPADTTAYRFTSTIVEGNYTLYSDGTTTATYPSIKIIGKTATIEEAPSIADFPRGEYGYAMYMTFSGGKVVDAEGNDITSLGTWETVEHKKIESDCNVDIYWIADGYYATEPVNVPVKVYSKAVTMTQIPTAKTLVGGKYLYFANMSGSKVVDADGNDVTNDAYLSYVDGYVYIDESGYFPAKWDRPGYDVIYFDVYVTTNCVKTNLVELPTAICAYGAYTGTTTFSGGKVTDENGNDITSTGKWAVVKSEQLYGDAEYDITWKREGYATKEAKITIKCGTFKASLQTPPAVWDKNVGDIANVASFKDEGVVVDESGNPISGGSWSVTGFPEGVDGLDKVYRDYEVEVTWKAAGYDTVVTKIPVTVKQPEDYNVYSGASLKVNNFVYAEGLNYEVLEIIPAEIVDKTTGEPIDGKYVLWSSKSLDAMFSKELTGQMPAGTDMNVYIHFIPTDTNLDSFVFAAKLTVSKIDFALAEGFEIILNDGSTDTRLVVEDGDTRFSKNIATVPAEAGIDYIIWKADDFDPSTAAIGSTTYVTATVYPTNKSYNNLTVQIPVTIQQYVVDKDFVVDPSYNIRTRVSDSNAGEVTYSIAFSQKRYKGVVNISVSDGTNETLIATVSRDENGLYSYENKWYAPADGEYTFKFEYVASDEDTATITGNTVITRKHTIDIRKTRTVTLKMGSFTETHEVVEGTTFSLSKMYIRSLKTDFDTAKFGQWKVTDANGNAYTPYYSPGTPAILDDLAIAFNMPEHDVTITALTETEAALGGDSEDLGSLWSFWQKLVDWIVSIYRLIVDFLVPTVETF